MKAFGPLTLLVLLPAALIAGPVKYSWQDPSYKNIYPGGSKCASTCTDTTKFGYEVGKTYRYAYEVTGVNTVVGASDESARVFASAIAHVHVVSKCEMALTLTDVSFKTSEPDSTSLKDVYDYDYTSRLEDNPLYFSFQDGRIEGLCITSAIEDVEATNFKRGILSAFQNSMSQHQVDQSMREIDVSGNCPTEYTVTQKGWKSTQITRSKDLLGCTNREHYKTSIHSSPFHLPDAIQSLPLLKGDLKCSQTLSKDGIMSLASCRESLVFRPFSKKESGAQTETTQKLELLDSQPGTIMMRVAFSRRTSMIYEHNKPAATVDGELWAVVNKADEIIKFSSNGISKEVPGLFAQMVYLMKELQYDTLDEIWSGMNNGMFFQDHKEIAKELLLDAFPTVGTKDSVKLMVDLLLSDVVSGIRSTLWLKSFAFIHHPNKDMIKDSFGRLLTSEQWRMESLLSVTSAIHNFCRDQEDCLSQKEVMDIVNILDDILGKDCKASDENLILTTLRAAGNLGFSDSLVPTLENCIEMSANKMNIRVTAIQAFRGVTCNAQRNVLSDTFQNKGEDSELRINAYLGLMMCPNQVVLEMVKRTLESEEINQVGSFVWTHLTNLAETSSPHKQEVKEILQDEKLKKEFDMDKRKYSRNYEISHFSERFGIGAMAETNLIWSSSSFFPRSLMLNLTVEVLGHSMNLLEVGGRVQGLQQMIHDYIGSKLKGFKDNDKTKNPSSCVNNGKMDDMKEKHAVEGEELSASMYFRMFGNEVDFKHFTKKDIIGLKNKLSSKHIIASLLKGDDKYFTHSAMFLDSTITVPTIAGMALHLSVNGTASVQLKPSGKMDRVSGGKGIDIRFDLQPSGAVQIGGEMTLNAGIMKSGLKMTTTLHSNTAFMGSVSLPDVTDAKLLTVTLDTPGEKLEVVDIQSEFFLIHTNAVRPQKMLKDKAAIQQKGCSDKFWLTGIGYEICGDVAYINATMIPDAPYFPLTGPLSASLVLHKRDLPRGLIFTTTFIREKDSSAAGISISTPASKTSRTFKMDYHVDMKAHSMRMSAITPWKEIIVEGSYDPSPENYKMSGTIKIDGKIHELTLKVDKDDQRKKIVMTPDLQILRPKDSVLFAVFPETLKLGGSITIFKDLDEISADIDINSNFKPNPIKLQANYINKKGQKTISAAVILNRKEGYSGTFQILETYYGKNDYPSKIKPTILISAPQWRLFLLSGNIDYKKDKLVKTNVQVMMDKTLKDSVVLNFKILKTKSRFKGNGKLSSQFGTIKSKGFVDVPNETKGKKKGPLISTKIVTSYNLPVVKDRALRRNLVVFSSKIHNRSSKSLVKYDASVNFESRNYQQASFVANADLTHKKTFTKSVITFKRGPKSKNLKDKSKQLKVETLLNHKMSKKDVDIKYDVKILYPLKAIEWQINGKHEHHLREKLSIETYNSFIYAKGKNSELRLKVDSDSAKPMDYTGLFEFNYPTFRFGKKRYQGQSYKMTSTIKENPNKEYLHSLQINVNEDTTHTMYTKFKKSKNANYDVDSQIVFNGKEKTKITLKSNRDDEKTESSVKVEKNEKVYQADTTVTKKDNHYTSSWDIIWPEKHVKGSWEADIKKDGEYLMKFLTFLDADKDMTKKVDANFVFNHQEGPTLSKFDVDMSLETPIDGYRIFAFKRLLEMNPKENKDEYKIVWRQKQNEWSYKYWQLKHPSMERYQMDFEVITPLEKLRMYRVEIRHKFDGSKLLTTSVKSKYNENDVSMDVMFYNKRFNPQNRLDSRFEINLLGAKRDTLEFMIGTFQDDLSFSPIVSGWPKSLKLHFNHDSDGRIYDSKVLFKKDDMESSINLHTTYTRMGKMINLNSKMNIVLQEFLSKPIVLEVKHANTLTNMNTTFSSKWGNYQKANLDFGATYLKHDQTVYIHYSGTTKHIHDLIYKHHQNTLNGWSGSTFSQVNKDIRTQYSCNYKITKTEFSYETFSSTSKCILKAEYERFPYTVYMKYSYLNVSKWYDIVFDGSVIKNGEKDWTSDIRLVTSFEGVRNIDIKGNLRDQGENKWALNGAVSMDVKKDIKLNVLVDTEKWSTIDAELESPWKDVSLNVAHKKTKRNLKTEVKLKYDENKEIVGKVLGRFKFPGKNLVSFELSTPFDELRTVKLEGTLLKVDNKWAGLVDLKSSNDKLKSLKVSFDHEDTSFNNNFEINSSAFDRVATEVLLDWGEIPAAKFSLNAPEIGQNMIGYTMKNKNSWLDFHNRIFGEIKGYELDIDLGLKHDELLTKAWLTFIYPGADKSYIKTSVHRIGNTLMDFDVGGDLQIGKNNRPYSASVQFSYIEGKSALGATLKNPHLEHDVSFRIKNELISKTGMERYIYGQFGEDYMLEISDQYNLEDTKYTSSHKNNYLFKGKGHTSGYRVVAEWSDDEEEVNMVSNLDDNKITLDAAHSSTAANDDNTDTIDVFVSTPFEKYESLELHTELKQEGDGKYSGKCSVEYMEGKEADLTFDIKQRKNKVIANGVLSLPIKGYEKNSLSYSQVLKKDMLIVEAEGVTGSGEQLKASLKFRNNEEFIFSLTGPIKEFKTLKIAGKYNEKELRLNGDIQLHLSLHPKIATLEYDIHMNDDPVVMTFKLRSPYENFRKAELTINHSGKSWHKFTSMCMLTSEKLGQITLHSTWYYKTPLSMEAKSTLTSSIKNMENLRLSFKTHSMKDRHVDSAIEVGWDTNKEITVHTTWKESNVGPRKMTTIFDMTTPFDEVKAINLKFSESRGYKILSRKMFVRHNERTYLDSEMTYKHEDKVHILSVDMQKPRPMSVSVEGKLKDKTFDGKMLLNWDKHSPESQFEFTTHVSDKSVENNIDTDFSFKVIHPVRIMAVQYLIRKASNEMQTSGLITWDESNGNTFSYDIGYTDRSSMYSKMYDAHVKLGVPQRSVKILGSYGDTGSARTMTGTALWDADRDKTKKVSVSTSHEYSQRMERLNMNLNLPSINKQLNVASSIKKGYGSSILDSKTEISYSSDPRKTIIVTNKVYNTVLDTEGNGNYNYKLETGFKHSVTDIDLQWLSHISQVDRIMSVGNQFTYLTLSKEKKVFAWRIETDKEFSGTLMITTPLKTVIFEGNRHPVYSQPSLHIYLSEDGKRTMAFEGKIQPGRKELDFSLRYDRDDPTKVIYVNGGYVNDKAAELIVFDNQNIYGKLNVKMNSSNIIYHQINWKPSLPSEFKNFMSTKVTAFSYIVKEIWDDGVKNVGAEVKAKYLRVSQELRDELGQVFELMRREMEAFNVQLETLRTQIRRIYNRNDLHIRDMGQEFEDAIHELLGTIQTVVKNYRSYYNTVSQATNDWIKNLKNYPVALMYSQTINDMIETMKEIRMVLEQTLQEVVLDMRKLSEVSYKTYLELSRHIDRKLNSYLHSKQKLAIFKQMSEERERLMRMGADYKPKETEMFDKYFFQIQQVLEDQYQDFMTRPEFQQLHSMGTEIYQQFKYWNAEKGVRTALIRMLDLSKNLLLMEMAKIKNMLLDFKKTRVTVYDPKKGELQFQIHVPFEMKSLVEPPEFKMHRHIKDTYTWIRDRIPNNNSSMWDLYYGYVPPLNPSQWVPPFEATGYVIGSQHIITFDKSHVDFMSTCSHVLVRDMLNDSFSVVLNYDKNPQSNGIKSLCFNIGNSLTLEITKDYQLSVNNQQTEMPFTNDLVNVVRDRGTITIRYNNGVEVVSNPGLDLYKVVLSGWFHGRTAGLLGVYDNEKKNDEAMIDRLHEFEVNRGSCNTRNVAVSADDSQDVNGICDSLFKNENSKFRPCFKQVDPSAFLQMCQVYLSTMSDIDAIHKATEQYRFVCQDMGVFMGPVKEYIPCNQEEKFYVDGREPIYQSADVVFVMEDAKCNKWASSSLANMVTKINKALSHTGMKNNRFGLTGYNGNTATVRTIHGDYFGKANVYLKAVETLRLTESDKPGDLVTAVRAAMRYPFRPGVAKVLVIAPCTSCQVGFLDRNLDSALQAGAFQVHILQEQGFSLLTQDSNKIRNFRIYGLDNTQTITNRVLTLPPSDVSKTFNDYCSTMARTTNGAIFDTTHLAKNKGTIQREFIKSFANKVSSSTKLPTCQVCQCNPATESVECQLCDTKSYLSYLPMKAANLNRLVGGFHDLQYDLKTSLNSLETYFL